MVPCSRCDAADTLHSHVPKDDDREAAAAILNSVVECTVRLNEGLRALAEAHFDTAPTSSLHVLQLNGLIARAVLDWIERWPSPTKLGWCPLCPKIECKGTN